MLLEEYVNSTLNIHLGHLEDVSLVDRFEKQALEHTSKNAIPESIKNKRPNELPEHWSYRLLNHRYITQELYKSFLSKAGRIFTGQGFRLVESSEKLRQRLDIKDIFVINYNFVDWVEYIKEYILPNSLVNPNKLHFIYPYLKEDSELPPYGNLKENEKPALGTLEANYRDIKQASTEFIIWDSGKTKIVDEVEAPILWAIDKFYWYTLQPTKVNQEGDVIHNLEKWYNHDFGFIPVNWFIGHNREGYKESFLSAAFEWLDETNTAISDDSTTRTTTAYPHVVMAALECDACQGLGKIKEMVNGELQISVCGSCGGNGLTSKPGQKDVLSVPKTNKNAAEQYIDPVLQFISPPVEGLKFLHDVAYNTFFINAFRSLGLKPNLNYAESGEAKAKRLEDQTDVLRMVESDAIRFTANMLLQIEYYEKRGIGRSEDIIVPKVSENKTLLVMDRDTLNNALKESVGYVQSVVSKTIYLTENGDTAKNERIADYARIYAPLLDKTIQQVESDIRTGAYGAQDKLRADYAYKIMETLSEKPDFAKWDPFKIKMEGDKLLAEWGILILEIGGEAKTLIGAPEQKPENG